MRLSIAVVNSLFVLNIVAELYIFCAVIGVVKKTRTIT
jgi:hypothetical protein